jgi:ELWxxDGT repeat protein
VGTILLKDIDTGLNNSTPSNFTNFGNKLLFQARTASNGNELWITDGSTSGTTIVKDIEPGTGSSSPLSQKALLNNKIYFSASTSTTGSELWETDGTTLGTKLMLDINTGVNGSYPSNLIVANGFLYFTADDGTNGTEVFKTDGTAAGTIMLAQISLSTGSSYANLLTLVGNTIYLTANDGTVGTELWKIELPATGIINELPELGIRLYPNPTKSNAFKLQFDALQAERATITVTSISGQIVYEEKLDNLPFLKQITLPKAAPGCYFVKVATDNGSVTKRLIVE